MSGILFFQITQRKKIKNWSQRTGEFQNSSFLRERKISFATDERCIHLLLLLLFIAFENTCLHKKKGRRGWKTVIEEVDLLFKKMKMEVNVKSR